MYTQDWLDEIKEGSRKSARKILGWLHRQDDVCFDSVLDVGCGSGIWLSHCQQLGSEIQGVDLPYVESLDIPDDKFQALDISQPFDLGRQFDLVISVEVAEHLPESVADTFIANLCRHGNRILFSAAIPNQGGRGHVNEQWPDYWARKFSKLGYGCRDIRKQFWDDQDIEWWYRQNCLFFYREDPYFAFDTKTGQWDQSFFTRPQRLVHPECWLEDPEFRKIRTTPK